MKLIHEEYKYVYGSRKMKQEQNNRPNKLVNYKRVETLSMSRKGNCWDNTPMESKRKQEWLNEQHFKTREEAKAAVYESIWIFYNYRHIHESNGYQTQEAYYQAHDNRMKAA